MVVTSPIVFFALHLLLHVTAFGWKSTKSEIGKKISEHYVISRSQFLIGQFISICTPALALYLEKEDLFKNAQQINLPLENCGGNWCTLFAIDGEVFRGVLDTGSPFITVAGSCTRRWGCYSGQGIPSGLEDTIENYAGKSGLVSWRKGMLEMGFLRSDLDDEGFIFSKVVFGILSDSLVGRPGGVFLGLVKYSSPQIRPTFLSQTNIVSLRFNFQKHVLSLSNKLMIPHDEPEAIQLIDLRLYGAPVMYYTAKVDKIFSQNRTIFPSNDLKWRKEKRELFLIFDTGTTGMAVSKDLFDEELRISSENGFRPFRNVQIEIKTERKGTMVLKSARPLTTPLDVPWKGFNEGADLIVAGLDFMQDAKMTIDIDTMRLLWEKD